MEEHDKARRQRPRQGWQRVTAKQTQTRETRETFRRDAPSPGQEILAKADAELNDEKPDEDSQIICF